MEHSSVMLLWRSVQVAVALGLLTALAVPACGGSSSDSQDSGGRAATAGASASGGGGAGSAGASADVTCGKKTCKGVVIQAANFTIPACCSDAETSRCGIDSSVLAMFGPTFSEPCQPLDQPGTPDDSCPKSQKTPISGTQLTVEFPGCCRPDHTCGYELDTIGGFIPLGLGCVDSSPFLDGGSPASCGEAGAPSQ